MKKKWEPHVEHRPNDPEGLVWWAGAKRGEEIQYNAYFKYSWTTHDEIIGSCEPENKNTVKNALSGSGIPNTVVNGKQRARNSAEEFCFMLNRYS